ncbi:hypothetical protein GUF49_06750, partial [Xanthomonas citri pv. citri]|nr:hypothetical protein [Xanthomonas citri pv. citri]
MYEHLKRKLEPTGYFKDPKNMVQLPEHTEYLYKGVSEEELKKWITLMDVFQRAAEEFDGYFFE